MSSSRLARLAVPVVVVIVVVMMVVPLPAFVLDVLIAPDRSYAWTHEDEVGFIGPEAAARARAEGEKVIALAAEGAFPFDGSFLDFRPPPEWPPTDLPPWWDAVTP